MTVGIELLDVNGVLIATTTRDSAANLCRQDHCRIDRSRGRPTNVQLIHKRPFSLGAHTVSETQQTGYELVGITGHCAADGSITLSPGDDKTCTITNDDLQRATTIQTIMSWTLKDAVDLGPDLVRGACGSPATITFRLYRHRLGTAKADLTCDTGSFLWGSAPLAEVAGAASTSHDVEEDGIYLWVVAYSGDNCNSAVTSDCGLEVTEITDEDLTPGSASPICTPAS